MQLLNVTPPSNGNSNSFMRIRSISLWIVEPFNPFRNRPAHAQTACDCCEVLARFFGFVVGVFGGILIGKLLFGVDRVEDAPPLKKLAVILFIKAPVLILGSIIFSVTMARLIALWVPMAFRAAVDLHRDVVMWNGRRIALNEVITIVSMNERSNNRDHTKDLPPELLGLIYSFLKGTTEHESYEWIQTGIKMKTEQHQRKSSAIGGYLTFFTPPRSLNLEDDPDMIELRELREPLLTV
jgi:hypothetical protein